MPLLNLVPPPSSTHQKINVFCYVFEVLTALWTRTSLASFTLLCYPSYKSWSKLVQLKYGHMPLLNLVPCPSSTHQKINVFCHVLEVLCDSGSTS